jgi:hypothetical protein
MKKVGYICTVLMALTVTAPAATILWDGGGGTGARSWMEPLNWNPDGVPASGTNYVVSSGVVDAKLANFAGDSLTLSAASAIVRYVDGNNWGINMLTNSAGIIRNQNGGLSANGSITNLTLAGVSRFLVDNITSSLALDIETLTIESGSEPYSYGSGSLTLNIGSINVAAGVVFRASVGTIDWDGAADTQALGLKIEAAKYVLDEARSFASLVVDGMIFGAGTYTFTDFQIAGKEAYFVDAGGSITVVASAGSEITWDDGDSGRSWMAALNWSDDQVPSTANSYVIGTSSASAPADVTDDFAGGSLTVNNAALLRLLAVDTTNFVSTLTLSNATVRVQHASRTSGGAVIRLNLDGPATFLVDATDSVLNINVATLSFGSEADPKKTGGGRLNLTAVNDVVADGEVLTLVTGSLSLSGRGSWEKAGLNISGGQYDLSGSLSVASLTVGTTNFNEGTYTHADFVAAGKGGSFIDNGGSIAVVGPPAEGYALWVENSGLSAGVNDGLADNPDGDALNNLYEYGLGGDPANGMDIGFVPTFGNDSGTMIYVHALRTDDSSLSYYLETREDLVSGNDWINSGYFVIGTNVTGGTFDYVTNAIPTAAAKGFVRLIIENNE